MSAVPQHILDLVAQRRHGDDDSLRQILTALVPRVRNLVRYLVRGDRHVDDIAQEALLEILRALDGYRGEGAFEGWVHRIVTRVVFAELKARRADEATFAPEEQEPGPGLWVVGQDDRPDDYLERRRLAEALDKLPDDQRYVVVMHHAVQMSAPEIAEALGVPLETVRSRLRLGRTKLRSLLGQEGSDVGGEP